MAKKIDIGNEINIVLKEIVRVPKSIGVTPKWFSVGNQPLGSSNFNKLNSFQKGSVSMSKNPIIKTKTKEVSSAEIKIIDE